MDPLITTIRPCPICSYGVSVLLHHHPLLLPDQLNYLPSLFNVVQCSRCHFTYNDSSLTEESLTRYYTSPYYASNRSYRNDAARIEPIARFICNQMYPGKVGIPVLDIGSGDGQLGKELRDLGFDVTDWDIGQPHPSSTYDIIILNHVLEHVLHPRGFIDSLYSFANPRAFLYVEVPDSSRYAESGYNSFAFFNFEHLNHFTIEDLIALLRMPFDWGRKEAEIFPTWYYPCLWGWWRMGLSDEITTYIDEEKVNEADFINSIKSQLNGRKTIYIRGYSNRAWSLIPKLLSQHIYIAGVIDAAPNIQQFTLNNIPVLRPQDELLDYPILVVADTPWVEEQMASEYLNIHEVIR